MRRVKLHISVVDSDPSGKKVTRSIEIEGEGNLKDPTQMDLRIKGDSPDSNVTRGLVKILDGLRQMTKGEEP